MNSSFSMSQTRPESRRFRPSSSIWVDDRRQLSVARHQNDVRFLEHFQSIINKYDRSFAKIGDEIDLETLEVAVDNGHLSVMRNDRDLGIQASPRSNQPPTQNPLDTVSEATHGADAVENRPARVRPRSNDTKPTNKDPEPETQHTTSISANKISSQYHEANNISVQPSDSIDNQNHPQATPRIPKASDTSAGTPSTPQIDPTAIEQFGRDIARQIASFLQRYYLASPPSPHNYNHESASYPQVQSPLDTVDRIRAPLKDGLERLPDDIDADLGDSASDVQLNKPSIWAEPLAQEIPHSPEDHSDYHFLTEDDKMLIKLKHEQHFSWTEIGNHVNDPAKLEILRRRWYNHLSKLFPHDGRVKSQRSALKTSLAPQQRPEVSSPPPSDPIPEFLVAPNISTHSRDNGELTKRLSTEVSTKNSMEKQDRSQGKSAANNSSETAVTKPEGKRRGSKRKHDQSQSRGNNSPDRPQLAIELLSVPTVVIDASNRGSEAGAKPNDLDSVAVSDGGASLESDITPESIESKKRVRHTHTSKGNEGPGNSGQLLVKRQYKRTDRKATSGEIPDSTKSTQDLLGITALKPNETQPNAADQDDSADELAF